eukprot:PITA_21030
MTKLALNLGFRQENSSPYYPQANGKVEAVNKSLKKILQRTIDKNHSNWHIMLYPALWAYRTSLVVELLPETSSLKERLVHLEHLDEQRRDAAIIKETHKKRVKTQYDKVVCLRVFSEGDLVLVYDQDKDALGAHKFKSMWHGPFIVKRVFEKGAYELVNFEGNKLAESQNELYLKKYFS